MQGEILYLGHGGALQGTYGRRVWEMSQAGEVGRFPSYHGGQLGNHVAERVDVALVPRVGSAQVPGHLTELLVAGGGVVLREKHTAQSRIMAENTGSHRGGRGS